jgi:ATP-binding cassette subfamily B protein
MSHEQFDQKRVLRFIAKEAFKDKRLWLCVAVMPVSALMINTAVPYLISTILGDLVAQTRQNWTLQIGLLVVAAALGIIANRVAFEILLNTQATTTERIQNNIVKNLLDKSASFYANQMTGKLISDGIGLGNAFIRFQDILTINLFPFVTTVSMGILLVSLQSLVLGAGLAVLTVVVIGTALYNSKRRAPLRYARHEARRKLHGYFADLVINNQSVKTFAQEKYEQKEHAKLNKVFTNHRIHDWHLVTVDGNNRIIMVLVLQILFVILLINQVSNNPALLSAGIFAFAFTITLSNRMFEISSFVRGLEDSITDAYPMIRILDMEPDIVDKPGAKALQASAGQIDFRNINFHYKDQRTAQKLFEDLSLSIKPGERVGLVGHSGGGKTTITKLLLRFADIQSGVIAVDGQDISGVTQTSLRRAIAYVPQEPMLFHRSLAENIAYGKPGATLDEIRKHAKMAHADEFINDLPDGYDTLVGERGVKLSGGQRQRVAIARAMLKDAPILVLDEATSALDSESEVLIQDALWKLMEGRTAIVIAHRLSTIQKMDRILVMEKGRIAEQGTHKELIQKNGTYAGLWNHQTGGFIEE